MELEIQLALIAILIGIISIILMLLLHYLQGKTIREVFENLASGQTNLENMMATRERLDPQEYQRIKVLRDNLVHTAQTTKSDWRPEDIAVFGGKSRTFSLTTFPEVTEQAIEKGKELKRNHASSDGEPGETDRN